MLEAIRDKHLTRRVKQNRVKMISIVQTINDLHLHFSDALLKKEEFERQNSGAEADNPAVGRLAELAKEIDEQKKLLANVKA